MLAKHPDYELINVDKIGIGANPANLHDIENDKRYTFIKGDICNPQLMNRLDSSSGCSGEYCGGNAC